MYIVRPVSKYMYDNNYHLVLIVNNVIYLTVKLYTQKSNLISNGIGQMKQNSLDGPVWSISLRGRRDKLGVCLKTMVDFKQETIQVNGRKKLWELSGHFP